MPAPETLVRARVAEIVEAEFAAEGFTVANDKLTQAHGRDGDACAAYPVETLEKPGQANVLIVRTVLQLYLAYEAVPDEHLVVDPGVIEGYGDRLRRAIADNDTGSSNDLWYIWVPKINYPDDPTGNKSRLEAYVEAHCANPAGPNQ